MQQQTSQPLVDSLSPSTTPTPGAALGHAPDLVVANENALTGSAIGAANPEPALRGIVWALNTGEAGMRSQARGLAAATGLTVVEKIVDVTPWLTWLPGNMVPAPLTSLTRGSDPLTSPWPDVVVSCGRRTTSLSIAIKRASLGRTINVHVQHPLCKPRAFDLIVSMRHDGLEAPNVLNVDTAMHGVTAEKLNDGRAQWGPKFANLKRPLIGVILGGRNRSYRFTLERAAELINGLQRIRAATGAGIAITPSRRTEPDVVAFITEQFRQAPNTFVWDMTGDNPYFGILGLADRLVVTSDSVSMISEALATGLPVETFDLDGRARRHEMFVDNLICQDMVQPFTGEPEPPQAHAPLDATRTAADAIVELLRQRRAANGWA